MKKLSKNRVRNYDHNKTVLYAYESAHQDGTSTNQINNMPSNAPSLADLERQERERREIDRIHAEARRKINNSMAAGAASGALAAKHGQKGASAAKGGAISWVLGVMNECGSCHP